MGTNSYVGERSAGDIVQSVMRDVGEVVRGEVRLARAEVTEKVSQAGKAAGMFGGAAVCGLLGAAALVAAAIAGLAIVLPLWASAAILAVILLVAAGVMFGVGRAKLKDVTPVPERTVQTLKDDVEWAKHPTR
jgi:hypothetical protein